MAAPVIDYRTVEPWLQRRIAEEIRVGWLGAAGTLAGGFFVTWLTFWVIFAILWIVSHDLLPSFVRLFAAAAGTGLLFVGNARTDREHLEEYSFTTSASDNRVVKLYVPGVGLASNSNPHAPDSVHSLVRNITRQLYTGPRLFNSGLRQYRRTQRLAKLDAGITAWVLAMLLNRTGRVTFAELAPQMPEHDPAEVFPPMRDLEGVVFSNESPPGLSLTAELRGEMIEDLRPSSQQSLPPA